MVENNDILVENEERANIIVAKVMLTTLIIFTLIYFMNAIGIFVVNSTTMAVAYVGSAVLLLMPMFFTYVLKWNKKIIKYVNVTGAALFVLLLSMTLTYHVVVIYVYPIAIASLYFSKRLNIYATSITVLCVSIGQALAFVMDTQKDDNLQSWHEVIVYGIIPRGLILVAMAVIFTMLCTRTVELLGKLMRAVEGQAKYHTEMVMGFATLVENKDGSTGGHIRRTSLYVKLLAEELKRRGLYEDILTTAYIENLCKAAPMHDIGKIAIPDSILQKPGKLTDEEFDIMKQHSIKGGEIIRKTFGHLENEVYTQMAYEVARYHHEKWNGRGYPEGLKENEIPLAARIMAVADVFDAVSEKRCYREAMPLEKCFEIISEGSGRDFEPTLVEAFLGIRGEVEKVHAEATK